MILGSGKHQASIVVATWETAADSSQCRSRTQSELLPPLPLLLQDIADDDCPQVAVAEELSQFSKSQPTNRGPVPIGKPIRNPVVTTVIFHLMVMVFTGVAARAEDRGVEDDSGWRWASDFVDYPNSFAIFAGSGTERTFSETLANLFSYDTSGDRVIAVAGRRQVAWYKDQLSIDVEVSFAHHFGRETYEEIGLAGYVRWHDFPWSDHLTTSFGVGLGPSYTTIYPELETQDDPSDNSKLLNQFNLELSLGLPEYPRTSLVTRLQHRSGIFGLMNGVTDASNFLMLGVEYRF